MDRRPTALLKRVRDAVEPPARLVDWSLFAIVVFETVTGLVSFTVGSASGWPLFRAHRIAGVTFIALLGFKLARVRGRLTDRREWQPSTGLSVLTAVAAVGALATGIAWVFGLDSRLSYWTLLSVHVGFGLVLFPLVVAHLFTRFRLPQRREIDGRRTTLKYTGLLVSGAVVYRLQEFANRALDSPGSDRRFTGSQPREGSGNGAFPVTSWVADDPDPVDREEWALTVTGAVREPVELGYDEIAPEAEHEALLDCTSGWYTVQRWQGLRVGDLLDAAGVDSDARYVRFVSVTGYRWSLPIEEAQDAVLATHVGDERLHHGHGAPARLVAPGRRGFHTDRCSRLPVIARTVRR